MAICIFSIFLLSLTGVIFIINNQTRKLSENSRSVELIFKTDSSIRIFTEVGQLWNSFTIPHFNTFYQKGRNNKGEVMIVVGKHHRKYCDSGYRWTIGTN
jgi:hypothetical protein